MEKIIPNGTEVLIFKNFKNNYEKYITDEKSETFIRGIVKRTYFSEDLSYHGSPEYVRLYEVLGEDGCTYKVSHFKHFEFNYFCRTVEEQINHLKEQIIYNKTKLEEKKETLNQEITKIEEINIIHENTINALNSYLDFSNKSKEIIRTLKK